MKRPFLTLLLFFICYCTYAQSVSFEDMQNITNMSSTQAHDLLTSKGFKPDGNTLLNGRPMEQYKIVHGTSDKAETVLIGASVKSLSGTSSKPVTYLTSEESDINNILAQAKKSTMTLVFQGADEKGNIFRFDNSLFRASISLSFDKKSGSVDLQQKE